MLKKIILIILLAQTVFTLKAQPAREKIKISNDKNDKRCVKCRNMLAYKDADIGFGVYLEGDLVKFYASDEKWFDELIATNTDGIAVDIVTKDQFACESKSYFKSSDHYRGYVLDPVYKNQIDASRIPVDGGIVFPLGQIPAHFIDKELEFNLIIIQKKYYCFYQQFYEVHGHKWDLLETGLYMDSVSNLSPIEEAIILNKRFEFEIPFEQNRYDYKPEDIRPIYDSLRLYNYNIKSVSIEAYSSIEGDYNNNKQLQEKRAQSILEALEAFQGYSLQADIRTHENWVDFFNDLPKTKYTSWVGLNKGKIKQNLKNREVLDDLEPILAGHRKAILSVALEKKHKLSHEDPDQLVQLFSQAILAKDIAKALEIQKTVYQYVEDKKVPENLPERLEVPQERAYSMLLNNKYVMQYERAPEYIYTAMIEFRKLLELVPDNPRVLFNLRALELKAWSYGDPMIDQQELLKNIKDLKDKKLKTALVYRLLINYYIIYGELMQIKLDYKKKNEALKNIATIYRQIELSADEALNIAKYFVGYRQEKWAIDILSPYIADIRTPEDLLFYYINLTVFNPQIINKNAYQVLLENAKSKNRLRFCTLFNSSLEGGVTFQLLNNLYLRKTYCENCENDDDSDDGDF